MTDLEVIVTKLRTAPSTTITGAKVVPFGSSPLPSPPYAVVKQEPTGLGYSRIRVIGHFAVNMQSLLETYVRKTVYDLLAYEALTGSGRRIVPKPVGIGQLVTTNSDSTISQEAVFQLPEIPYT